MLNEYQSKTKNILLTNNHANVLYILNIQNEVSAKDILKIMLKTCMQTFNIFTHNEYFLKSFEASHMTYGEGGGGYPGRVAEGVRK